MEGRPNPPYPPANFTCSLIPQKFAALREEDRVLHLLRDRSEPHNLGLVAICPDPV